MLEYRLIRFAIFTKRRFKPLRIIEKKKKEGKKKGKKGGKKTERGKNEKKGKKEGGEEEERERGGGNGTQEEKWIISAHDTRQRNFPSSGNEWSSFPN